MVETRSGAQVDPVDDGKIRCHKKDPERGRTCYQCSRLYCDTDLERYYPSTQASSSSGWKCYYCEGNCCCSECKKRKQKPQPQPRPQPTLSSQIDSQPLQNAKQRLLAGYETSETSPSAILRGLIDWANVQLEKTKLEAGGSSQIDFSGILTSLPKPGGGDYGKFYSLPAMNDPRIEKLPYSIRIILESAICNCDNFYVTKEDVEIILNWEKTAPKQVEIPFIPARVLLQDFTGVPAVVDLACMRDAVKKLGGDYNR